MFPLLLAHILGATVAPALVRWMGRKAFLPLAVIPLVAFIWTLSQSSSVLAGEGPTEAYSWVPAIGVDLTFRMDILTWVMLLIVTAIGALVLVYCSVYFSATATGLGRFAGVLTAFVGAMIGLVSADNMIVIFTFWELTTIFSYLLIGHYYNRKASRRAAMQAIIVTTAGGLAMLVGMILLGQAAGTYEVSEIIANPPSGTTITVAIVLLLIGAASKSALVPMHFWLPAAMAAPTPVSAYLHAAAMVKAGVYLVARFAPAYAEADTWRWMVLILGGTTMLVGGYRALRQYDLKLILAFGTVSQLGMLIMLVGHSSKAVALAGLTMLVAHALFKAALFLTVGTIDVSTGTRDLRRLSGLGKRFPLLALAAGLATASMMGLPPLLGYVGKEAALEAFVHSGTSTDYLTLVVMAVGSALTVGYGIRFWWGAFAKKSVELLPDDTVPANTGDTVELPAIVVPAETAELQIKRPTPLLVWPAVVLAFAGLVFGLMPTRVESGLTDYAATYPAGHSGHLTLWAGFSTPFFITVAVVFAGVGLFLARRPIARLQARLSVPVSAEGLYRHFMRRLDDVAADVTASTQRGSLPFYLGVILVVFVIGVQYTLFSGWNPPDRVRLWDSPAQLIFGAGAVTMALFAARARRRLKAVLMAGLSGYFIVGLYLMHGAPDLALTQTLVETITLVVFVLVLRRLPSYFSNRPLRNSRWFRLGLAGFVGLSVAGIMLVAPSARIHTPTSNHYAEEGVEFGGGKNLVNVTLVDIRAWDTMGEISVLLVAATGVASLVFLQRRGGRILRSREVNADVKVWGSNAPAPPKVVTPTREEAPEPQRSSRSLEWLRGGRTVAAARRSVIFELTVRLLFHTMIVFSVYLLFAGHNQPGGGFVAGLIAGLAFVVRYLAAGRYELGEAAPVQPGLLLGSGLFLAAGYGIVAMLSGLSVLESVTIDMTLPLIGDIHVVSSLFFDIGVYLVVLGLMLDILRSLGAEIDQHIEDEEAVFSVGGDR